MKILFCNYEYPPLGGGGGVVMAALAQELARRHEVTVLTSGALRLPAEEVFRGVRVIRVPVFFRRQLAVANLPSMAAYLPMGLQWALRKTHRGAFDVINTHFVVPTGPLGAWLARWYRVPNVLSVHGGDLFDPSKGMSPHRHGPLRVAVRRMLTKADAVVGQSRDTVAHVDTLYGVRRNVDLIPLGIDRPNVGAPGSRADFGIPADAFVAVTVGRVVPRKRTEDLVRALADPRLPKAHLLVVGDGPEVPLVRRTAEELGVSDRIHLLGYVTDEQKFRAMSIADVFASTSQHEGFGLVFLEAMALGLPVVCYDRGGQTDFLATGETGHVVRLNDLDGFRAALAHLYEDTSARRDIGAHNRSKVEGYFIDRCALRYEEVFDRVLARS